MQTSGHRSLGVLAASLAVLLGVLGAGLARPADALPLSASGVTADVFFDDTDLPVAGGGEWLIRVRQPNELIPTLDPTDFFIIDRQNSTNVVTLESSANNADSLVVDPSGNVHLANDTVFIARNGNVGIGTIVPASPLHVRGDIRVEPGGGDVWRFNPGGSGLWVRDVTSVTNPVKFQSGAPTDSLVVASNGRIGLGTDTPGGNIHISGLVNQDLFSGIGPDPVAGPALNFGYSGSSFGRGSGFFNVRPDASAVAPNPSIRFATVNVQRVIITNTGNVGIGTTSPSNPLQMGSGAFVSAGGVWTNASSREGKQDIQPLTGDEARAALERLDPVKFASRVDPAERHVGFIAEDVPELVATADRKTLSPMDIVAVLTRVVQEQQQVVREQQKAVQEQQRAIAELSAEVAALRSAGGPAR